MLATIAAAGPTGGGGKGGGGGALSHVSAGISAASHGPSPSSAGGGSREVVQTDGIVEYCYDRSGRVLYPRNEDVDCLTRVGTADGPRYVLKKRRVYEPAKHAANVDFYAGAQKVHDSDGSASIEIAVTDERFRVGGTFTRYFERLQGGGALTMSIPTLMGGFRIDDMGDTAVFLEGGVVHARTNGDQMADSSITGPIAGVRVEHSLSPALSLIGDAQQMWFDDDIRATAGRVGVRYRYVQASVRVLDFNVGPPLWGPEVGVRF